MGDIVPRSELTKQGMKGFGGIGGGIGLLVLNAVASGGLLPALIFGGILTVVGLAISTSREDRNAGLVAAGAGILTMLTRIPILGGVASGLMVFSGVGLLLAGGYQLFKFFRNLRKRA